MSAGHDVEPDQFEPGRPDADQAYGHLVDLALMDTNLFVSVGLSGWAAVEVSLPVRLIRTDASFTGAQGEALPGFESLHHRDETLFGLGDLGLGARFQVIGPDSGGPWTLSVQPGLSVPTGGTEENPFALGREGRKHQHMFFGSGTFDPRLGVDVGYAFEGWSLTGGAQGKASLYANDKGYQGPGQLNARLHAVSGFGLEAWTFQAGPELFVESTATWSGEPAENSGRVDVIASVGARVALSDAWAAFAQAKVPWTVTSEGGQLSTPFIGVLGVSFAAQAWD